MIEMNAVSHDDLVGMGKQWMDKLRLSASPLDENELLEIAERSRGSIRDFGNDLIRSASKR
jgi:hypothetical protein